MIIGIEFSILGSQPRRQFYSFRVPLKKKKKEKKRRRKASPKILSLSVLDEKEGHLRSSQWCSFLGIMENCGF